jgi:hypothetical protein
MSLAQQDRASNDWKVKGDECGFFAVDLATV